MIARGQYSTLRREADQRLKALASQWNACSSDIRDALSYRADISECRPLAKIDEAAERVCGMREQAAEIERICKQLSELKPIAWGQHER
ncbi:MAG: hypothetical protein RBR77_07745 [Thauera sp.]|nr:hypothetical protein [Thauera sp.]